MRFKTVKSQYIEVPNLWRFPQGFLEILRSKNGIVWTDIMPLAIAVNSNNNRVMDKIRVKL